MKTDLTGLALPTCDIMVNGQKRKLYGKKKNKVYLQNGDNFQLNVFNPLQERIGVSLKINGTNVDNDLLIINPGQEFVIERYIGTNRKLTFSAYDIDTSNMSEERVQEAKKAIEKNGVLEVLFWNEKIAPPPPPPPVTYKHMTRSYCSGNSNSRTYNSPGIFSQDMDLTYQTTSTDVVINGNLTVTGDLTVGTTTDKGCFGDIGPQGPSGTKGTSGLNGTSGASGVSGTSGCSGGEPSSKKIETGRIEKGEVSNQYFKRTAFEIGDQFYKIKFKLLPFSIKPVKKKIYDSTTIKKIVEGSQTAYRAESTVREYCKCGYRVSRGKGAWNNCPMCGRKIK